MKLVKGQKATAIASEFHLYKTGTEIEFQTMTVYDEGTEDEYITFTFIGDIQGAQITQELEANEFVLAKIEDSAS